MAGNLLNIGKTGLFAAQVGLSTTGHNISNANVAGYTRQVVVQSTTLAQDFGYGFVGTGTQIAEIKRYSDEFMNAQVRSAQASASSLNAYHAQIGQIDNLLADPTAGLSPALQDFFKAVQDVASNPASVASRQSLMSNADMLSARFQSINGRMQEIRDGVNSKITTSVTEINSYAQQIAQLNEQIGALSNSGNRAPNDLLDTRDQLVADLNKQVKATVVKGENNSLTISIGSGQPLVVGKKAFGLALTTSPTDVTRVEVGYQTGGKVTVLSESALSGGELGGVFEFRSRALDRAQNSLGRIAISLASTFNAQHRLGIDSDDQPGGNFFKQADALVTMNQNNNMTSTTAVSATIVDPTKLTQSDYKLDYDGGNFFVTRLSDNQKTVIAPYPQTGLPQTIDGVAFSISGSAAKGDNFAIRPTINGAAQFKPLLTDLSKIAAGAPIATSAPITNSGSGTIGEGSVDAKYLLAGNALTGPVTLTYAGGSLSGFPAGQSVTVKVNGVATAASPYAAGTASIPYTAGASYSFGGVNLTISGQPNDNDQFVVDKNVNGAGDNRNMRLLGALQSKPIMDGDSATYQGAYAELVSFVGNKTREVQVNGAASDALLAQVHSTQQDVAGVNLDEEAANLIKYQQAYQASGKVMQTATVLFDTLLSIGN